MFRLSSRLNGAHSRKKVASLLNQKCLQSTRSKGSNRGVNLTIAAVAGVTTLGASIVGYSAWSNENRKFIEESMPGSSVVLETLLGPMQTIVPPTKPVIESGLLQKKLEREKAKKTNLKIDDKNDMKSDTNKIIVPPLPSPPLPSPPLPEIIEKANIETRLDASEKTQEEENSVLSKLLEDNIIIAQKQITSALTAADDAAKVVRQHAEKAYAAIDSGEGHENLYAAAAEVAKLKKEVVKIAEDKLIDARSKIEELQKKIEAGRDSKLTKGNKTLDKAEEVLSELKYAISRINSTVAEALRDSAVINEFKDLVEAGRKQFEAEYKSLLPDVHLGEKSEKLTKDELNLLLAHAYRKVAALQTTLAKQQTVDKVRFKDSVLRQREQETRLLDGKLHSELERQRRDLGLEHRHRLSQLREDLETELRMQLKRQAAAHTDHLADVLHVQERELERKWENKLQCEIQKETDRYLKELSAIQGNLHGLKAAMKSRADVDKAAHAAHELWAACESLRTALRLGKAEAHSWEEQLVPLKGKVDAIRKVSGENDPFVDAVLNSISEVSLNRGVYTEDALRERFLKVDRVCRGVALIGENGGSLFKYLLSYVQSFFLLNEFDQIPGNELRDEKFDVNKLNTHDILARARYCIAKDDLLQTVRYLNLLKGEPRHVASDWVKEAILVLEAKQAANAMMAHAAAQGVKAL